MNKRIQGLLIIGVITLILIMMLLLYSDKNKQSNNSNQDSTNNISDTIRKIHRYKITKPDKVPKDASWGGSFDGGYWFELLNVNKQSNLKLRIKIYTEAKGELLLDANFNSTGTCELDISKQNFSNLKKSFLMSELVIENCRFRMDYPAFGGTYWEYLVKIGKDKPEE